VRRPLAAAPPGLAAFCRLCIAAGGAILLAGSLQLAPPSGLLGACVAQLVRRWGPLLLAEAPLLPGRRHGLRPGLLEGGCSSAGLLHLESWQGRAKSSSTGCRLRRAASPRRCRAYTFVEQRNWEAVARVLRNQQERNEKALAAALDKAGGPGGRKRAAAGGEGEAGEAGSKDKDKKQASLFKFFSKSAGRCGGWEGGRAGFAEGKVGLLCVCRWQWGDAGDTGSDGGPRGRAASGGWEACSGGSCRLGGGVALGRVGRRTAALGSGCSSGAPPILGAYHWALLPPPPPVSSPPREPPGGLRRAPHPPVPPRYPRCRRQRRARRRAAGQEAAAVRQRHAWRRAPAPSWQRQGGRCGPRRPAAGGRWPGRRRAALAHGSLPVSLAWPARPGSPGLAAHGTAVLAAVIDATRAPAAGWLRGRGVEGAGQGGGAGRQRGGGGAGEAATQGGQAAREGRQEGGDKGQVGGPSPPGPPAPPPLCSQQEALHRRQRRLPQPQLRRPALPRHNHH
jgi:hypothetical protein